MLSGGRSSASFALGGWWLLSFLLCPCGSGRSVAVVWMCCESTQTDNLRYKRKYTAFLVVGGITYRLLPCKRLFCVYRCSISPLLVGGGIHTTYHIIRTVRRKVCSYRDDTYYTDS